MVYNTGRWGIYGRSSLNLGLVSTAVGDTISLGWSFPAEVAFRGVILGASLPPLAHFSPVQPVSCSFSLVWFCLISPVGAPCYNFITAARDGNVMGGVDMAKGKIHAPCVRSDKSQALHY